MKHFEGRVAAVTGAASGIGRALAIELARRGCNLALSDVDEIAKTTPAKAARIIVEGVRKNKRRVLIGADAKAINLLARFPAAIVQRGIVLGAKRRAR